MTQPSAADGATLLYIEDNPINRHVVSRILAKHSDYRLLLADEPQSGLRLARSEQPALILLDLNLPTLSGFEVLEQLRGDATTCDIPVIAVTASQPGDEPRLKDQTGFDGYLPKPISKNSLLAIIGQALESTRPAR